MKGIIMSMVSPPRFGSSAYNNWHNDYEGSQPARVAPRDIGSLDEALDSIGRLTLRLRYWENRERRLSNMDIAQKTPYQREAHRTQIIEASSGIDRTKLQIVNVAKYNLPFWPVTQP
jgi:hypothetical protein